MNDLTPTDDEASTVSKETPEPEANQEKPAVAETAAGSTAPAGGSNIDAMLNVGMAVQVVLGRARMPISELLKLSRGSIIELDKVIGQPVEVVISDRLVARGDLVQLDDERLGVKLTEIVKEHVSDL